MLYLIMISNLLVFGCQSTCYEKAPKNGTYICDLGWKKRRFVKALKCVRAYMQILDNFDFFLKKKTNKKKSPRLV